MSCALDGLPGEARPPLLLPDLAYGDDDVAAARAPGPGPDDACPPYGSRKPSLSLDAARSTAAAL